MNKIILFDIDRTIFDTSKFGRKIEAKIARIVSANTKFITDIKNIYKAKLQKDTDFLPRELLKEISLKFNYSYEKLLRTYFADSEIFNDSLYEDTPRVFKSLGQNGYRIGIFSEGDEEFQEMKIKNPNVSIYLDRKLIFIAKRKLDNGFLGTIPRGSIIVDDTLGVIESLLNFGKHTPVYINRQDHTSHPVARTIHRLSELI